jgi:hypothetical protein
MEKHPASPRRRKVLEAVIRVVDLVVYGAVFLGGIYALTATPNSVVDELAGAEWLLGLWAALLLGGGLVGFLGRLTRYWLVENPGTVAAFFGIMIYFVVLGKFAFASVTSAVAVVLVLVAMAFMVRRWLELQIFGTDPDRDWRARVAAALHRRTANVVPRS